MAAAGKGFVESSETLCEVIAVFRHGHRAPVMFLPSDPNKNFWSNGPGNLSNVGKEDGYLIGRFLRERYSTFLNEKYEGTDIYVRSTDVDRNLMTAQCCLAGLYPPKGDDVWLPHMTWQPIPVHTVQFGTDPLIPQFSNHFTPPPNGDSNDEATAAYKIISKNQHVIDAITSEAKADGNITVASLLLDAFIMEVDEGLPAYLTPGLQESPQDIRQLVKSIFLLQCKTGICRTSATYLLEEVVKQISRKIAGEIPKQKAFLYCMHDLTISSCLEAFNSSKLTNFGAILLFELHKHPEASEYFIKIIFKSSVRDVEDPEVISINGTSIIPFCTFEEMVKTFAASTKDLTN